MFQENDRLVSLQSVDPLFIFFFIASWHQREGTPQDFLFAINSTEKGGFGVKIEEKSGYAWLVQFGPKKNKPKEFNEKGQLIQTSISERIPILTFKKNINNQTNLIPPRPPNHNNLTAIR